MDSKFRVLKQIVSVVLLSTFLLSPLAFAEKNRCEKLLTKTAYYVTLPITWPVRKIYGAGKTFVKEVREQGSERIYGPLRVEPEKLGIKNYLSVTDLISRARVKYWEKPPIQRRPGAIITTLVWLLILDGGEKIATHGNDIGIEQAADQDFFGAQTILEWEKTGAFNTDEGREIFFRVKKDFSNKLAPLRQREKDFLANGWWSAATARLAEEILGDLVRENSPDQLFKRPQLAGKIAAHPKFRDLAISIPPEFAFTLGLWLTPPVSVFGRVDTDWIALLFEPHGLMDEEKAGLESLKPYVVANLQNPSIVRDIELIALTVKDKNLVAEKRKRAKELTLPAERGTFARVDYPPFHKPQVYQDGENQIVLNDEIDRWNLIWRDPRFSGLKQAWLRDPNSDQFILAKSELFLKSGTFRFTEKAPSFENACQMVYGAGDQPGIPMFENLQDDVDGVAPAQKDRVIYARVLIYADAFVRASRDPAHWDDILADSVEKEKSLLESAIKGAQLPGSETCPH